MSIGRGVEARAVVLGAGGDEVSPGAELDRRAPKPGERAAVVGVEQRGVHHAAGRRPHGREPVARESELLHGASGTERAQERAVLDAPETDSSTTAAGRELPTIRGKDRGAHSGMAKHEHRPTVHVAHKHAAVSGDEHAASVWAERCGRHAVDANAQHEQPPPRLRVVHGRTAVLRADDRPARAAVERRRGHRTPGRQHQSDVRFEQRRAQHVRDPRRPLEPGGREPELQTPYRIAGQIRESGSRELARVGVPRLRSRMAALGQREQCDRRHDRERDRRGDGDREQPSLPPACGAPLPLESPLEPPRLNRLDEHVVEDLVPVRAVDAVHDAVPGKGREHAGERLLRHVRVFREIRRAMRDLRPGRRHEMLEELRRHVLLLRRETRERVLEVVAHDRRRTAERTQRLEPQRA